MSYYFSTIMEASFEEAITRVAEELNKEGFGILTNIDVKDTLKKKLDVDFRRYKILGACNPMWVKNPSGSRIAFAFRYSQPDIDYNPRQIMVSGYYSP